MAIIVIKKITVVSYILKTPNPIIKYPVSMERIAKIEIAISDMKAQERKLKLINQSARTGIIAAEKIANLDILLMEFYHVSFLLMSLIEGMVMNVHIFNTLLNPNHFLIKKTKRNQKRMIVLLSVGFGNKLQVLLNLMMKRQIY